MIYFLGYALFAIFVGLIAFIFVAIIRVGLEDRV